MAFPLTHRGEIVCKRASDASVLFDRILEELRDAGLQNVQVWEGRISFEGAKGQRKPKNHFSSIDVGEMEISMKDGKLAISYRLRFKGLLFLTIASVMVGLWLLNFDSGAWLLPWYAISWLVSVVWNYRKATSDFDALVRRAQMRD